MNDQNSFIVNHATLAIFGIDSHEQTGTTLKDMGCKKVIAIYDPTIGTLGIAGKVIANIRGSGIEVVEFDGVVADPTSDVVDMAGALGRRECVDGVVGIGGGSSLDTAKGANLLLANPGSISDYIGANRGKTLIKKGYPLVLLPTTAGTSAEITPVFVVTEKSTNLKTGASNRGDVAINDPQFTLQAPPHVTATTGIDMLAHVTESITNPKIHWMTDFMDEKVIELTFRYLPVAYQNGYDLEARTQLSFACMTAGYAFADKGTHIGHAIADRISNKFHWAHGMGCALGLMVAVRYAIKAYPNKIRRIAGAIGLPVNADMNDDTVGGMVLEAYRSLQTTIGLKSMKQMGIDEDLIEFIISDLPNDRRFKNNPYAPDYKTVATAILEEYQSA